MEIHKPKLWHGWREFLKEYAIIVVGVLTPLAEQVVEALHHRELVRTAEAPLRDNFRRFVEFKGQIDVHPIRISDRSF